MHSSNDNTPNNYYNYLFRVAEGYLENGQGGNYLSREIPFASSSVANSWSRLKWWTHSKMRCPFLQADEMAKIFCAGVWSPSGWPPYRPGGGGGKGQDDRCFTSFWSAEIVN